MTRAKRLITATGLMDNEAIIVYKIPNLFYLTGFRGEGIALLSQKQQAIVTDFRYVEQAEKESPDFCIVSIEKGQSHEQAAALLAQAWQVDSIRYEDDGMTVRDFAAAQKAFGNARWTPLHEDIELLRQIKDDREIALIKEACRITGESFERILPIIREGVSEREIAIKLEFDMLTHGAESIAFSTIVAAGANGSLPHARPGEYRIRRGDLVTLDFGAKVGGYCADMTRTVAVGEPSDQMRHVYETVKAAQQMAQDAVRAGGDQRAIDAIARDYIAAAGYEGRFGHGLGHSLGIEIHENPRLNAVANGKLRTGQLITVEPGIYLPGVGGVRIENSVVVLEDGCQALTLPTRELIILPA